MHRRAAGTRVLCSELVSLKWIAPSGVEQEITADLEAISPSEAWLQIDAPIPESTLLSIGFGRGELKGVVRGCIREDDDVECLYGITVQLDGGTPWSRRRFTPKHLLDPAVLVVHNLMRELKPQIASAWPPRSMTA